MPKFEIKNALCEYLWPKTPDLGIVGLEFFEKTIAIFEISTFEFA